MRQTLAIFLDAYRELNSRKLFWIVLLISLLVVVVFASVGIDGKGFTFLHWSLGFGLNTAMMPAAVFYKQFLFANLGVKFWLGIIAAALALVSTASIFPDLVSGGAIELVLSKPISRLRLFITKYLTGLFFVTLQVTVFTLGSFLVIGLRGGLWEPRILLAIPIVVAFFSYLFCICALLGIVTRSSIASLLVTILIWFLIFIVHAAEGGIGMWRMYAEERSRILKEDITHRERELEQLRGADSTTGLANVRNAVVIASKTSRLADREKRLAESEAALKRIGWIDFGMTSVKTVLPKMADTKDLLERSLLTPEEREQMLGDTEQNMDIEVAGDDDDVRVDMGRVQRKVVEHKLSLPIWWVIGTSLGFEALMLSIAAWLFVRRDF